MEWVETTGKTVEEAKDHALDQLGVGADEAEFEVLEAPRPGLFGRLRGEARVRSRVRPNEVRPKVDRRRRRSDRGRTKADDESSAESSSADTGSVSPSPAPSDAPKATAGATSRNRSGRRDSKQADRPKVEVVDEETEEPSPDEVGKAAVEFMDELVGAFGLDGTTSLSTDGVELDIAIQGDDLGLLIGPGGRTLMAVQNLARVAAQRRLGDHDTRLRVDVAGYREKRRVALEAFAERVAAEVRESGTARALEPMTSADRKIIHDALTVIDGVGSRSEGDDPRRYVVVTPES